MSALAAVLIVTGVSMLLAALVQIADRTDAELAWGAFPTCLPLI